MTHSELVKIGAKWLKNHYGNMKIPNCPIIAKELKTSNLTGEIPDILGFCSHSSVMIEVKTSRADFLKDQEKSFRFDELEGMGNYKCYLCPESLIKECEIPLLWGLIYVREDNEIYIVKPPIHHYGNIYSERKILYSILRRKK